MRGSLRTEKKGKKRLFDDIRTYILPYIRTEVPPIVNKGILYYVVPKHRLFSVYRNDRYVPWDSILGFPLLFHCPLPTTTTAFPFFNFIFIF